MKKYLLVIGLTILTVTSVASTHANDFVDEHFTAPQPPDSDGGDVGLYIDDVSQDFTPGPSFAVGITAPTVDPTHPLTWTAAAACKSINDPECTSATFVEWAAYLPPCVNSSDTNCIDSVLATKPDGSIERGQAVANYPASFQNSFTGDPKLQVPNGSTPSLWTFPTVSHSGGNQFLVTALASAFGWTRNNIGAPNLAAAVYPVNIQPGKYFDLGVQTGRQDSPAYGGTVFNWWGPNHGCLMNDQTSCAVDEPFPANTKFSISIRSSFDISGWLHGRMSSPEVTITKNGQGQNLTTVSAYPVKVPVFSYWTKSSNIPSSIQDQVSAIEASKTENRYCDNQGANCSHQLILSRGDLAYSQKAIDIFGEFLKLQGNSSAAEKSEWSIRSLNSNGQNDFSPCSGRNNQLNGLVATNGSMYIAAPPSFNKSTGTLNYIVASPHTDHNGQPNTGFYGLILRSDLARCLYNYSNAPLKADISVVSSDGSQQVVTTSFTEKSGWLNFNANGFTYSSPTISVKLRQDASVKTNAPIKQSLSITCAKGKLRKVVTGKNPTCPAGYRKV